MRNCIFKMKSERAFIKGSEKEHLDYFVLKSKFLLWLLPLKVHKMSKNPITVHDTLVQKRKMKEQLQERKVILYFSQSSNWDLFKTLIKPTMIWGASQYKTRSFHFKKLPIFPNDIIYCLLLLKTLIIAINTFILFTTAQTQTILNLNLNLWSCTLNFESSSASNFSRAHRDSLVQTRSLQVLPGLHFGFWEVLNSRRLKGSRIK